MLKSAFILWKRLDTPGHDACAIAAVPSGWQIDGVAVFKTNRRPAHLSYSVQCGSAWQTLSATVDGRIGDQLVHARIHRSASGRWKLDGKLQPQLTGCDDLDLAFTPATNTIALRRLALRSNERANVRAAWFNIIENEFSELGQTYTKLSRDQYQYESARFKFRARLTVNTQGIVTNYPTLWKAEP